MRAGRRSDPGVGFGQPRFPGSFLLAFREAAAEIHWQLERLMQDVALCVDADGKEHIVGLENLYRRARRAPRPEWPQIIAEFLQTVRAAEQTEHLPADLASVTEQILPRLGYPLKAPADAAIWFAPLNGTDLVINLVIDYPDRMCYVTESLIQSSNQSGLDWLEQARMNLLARTPDDCFQQIHPDSGIRICRVGDAYDSSRALLLGELLPETRADGYLTVLPGRDELLVLPVTADALPHLHLMKVLADKNFRNVPYPISDQVFWIRDGVWRRFPIRVQAKEVLVDPPPEFVEILNRLCPESANPAAPDFPTESE